MAVENIDFSTLVVTLNFLISYCMIKNKTISCYNHYSGPPYQKSISSEPKMHEKPNLHI